MALCDCALVLQTLILNVVLIINTLLPLLIVTASKSTTRKSKKQGQESKRGFHSLSDIMSHSDFSEQNCPSWAQQHRVKAGLILQTVGDIADNGG